MQVLLFGPSSTLKIEAQAGSALLASSQLMRLPVSAYLSVDCFQAALTHSAQVHKARSAWGTTLRGTERSVIKGNKGINTPAPGPLAGIILRHVFYSHP